MKLFFQIAMISMTLTLMVVVPAFGQQGASEVESNDTRDVADAIDGYTIQGEVGSDDGEDWFILQGQEGYNPTFILYYDDSRMDIDCEVYSGNTLVGSLTEVYSPESGLFNVAEDCYIRVWASSGYGDYTIEITPEAEDDMEFDIVPAEGCQGQDEVESNDESDVADAIDGYQIVGYICEGDVDWFELQGQEGFQPQITLNYDAALVDIDMSIYSDKELVGELAEAFSPDSGSFEIPDVCYLKVFSYAGEGDYIIDITPTEDIVDDTESGGCQGADEQESNDTLDVADVIDDLDIYGYACSGETDWFVLQGQEGFYPSITLYHDADVDIDVIVYSDGEQVGTLTESGSPDFGSFEVTGTCYLEVYTFDGEGAYTIDIVPGEDVEGDVSIVDPGLGDCQGLNEVESNDDIDVADAIDSLEFSGYACADENDWFVLQGQEGTNPKIILTYDADYCDIDLEVWSGDIFIGALTDTGSPDSASFEVPDECYIRVFASAGEGDYTVQIVTK